MAPGHFVWVIVSDGRWQHMSDTYVACQYEDKLMQKITNCAQLRHVPCFCGFQHCRILRTYKL